MGALTEKLPKPMLIVNGKTLLEHKFDALPDEVDEIILIVGYLKEKIQEHYGDSYNGKKLVYIEQKNIAGGTADALWQAKDILTGRFLVLMGDDIYARADLEACLTHEWSLLVQHVPDVSVGGHVVIDSDDQHIVDIVEHVHSGEGFVSSNVFALDTRIFDHPMSPKAPGSKEFGLPQTVLASSKISGVPFTIVEATQWIQITTPDDLAKAEKLLSTQ